MKFFMILAMMMTFNVFAQGGGDHIGSGMPAIELFDLIIPSSFMAPEPVSTKISIFVNGYVVKTVSKGFRDGRAPVVTYKRLGIISDMSAVNKCATELKDQVLTDAYNPGCADDVGSRYESHIGHKMFAVRQCGQLKTVESSCAKEIVKILDSFLFLAR